MKLHSDKAEGAYRITAYGADYVVVNDVRIRGSVVVTPEQIIRDWAPRSFSEMTVESFDVFGALNVDIVILGTGASQQFPDSGIVGWFGQRGIGLEVMDTAAACRTYNILVSEGRTVAAMLLPIQP
ncbi:MAG TPA: Mth938-like domain-containing protein [Gammaproteobacteria bacterium]